MHKILKIALSQLEKPGFVLIALLPMNRHGLGSGHALFQKLFSATIFFFVPRRREECIQYADQVTTPSPKTTLRTSLNISFLSRLTVKASNYEAKTGVVVRVPNFLS